MPLTAEQIEALPYDERNAYWSREFADESERLVRLLPAITEFCRHYQVRFEQGPMNGMTVVSTRPVTPGGAPAWIETAWEDGAYVATESEG